jgi:formamidopyrimidine-DNA glycosylase
MPELPEVETIVRWLREGRDGAPPLPGQVVKSVTLRWARHIAQPSPAAFKAQIRNRTIRQVQRRGKFITLVLDRGVLLIHLKMSGELKVLRSRAPRERFEHTVFHLESGWDLRFLDARKFGKVFLLDNPEGVLGPLGPDPLDPRLSARILGQRLARHRRAVKNLLLDQSFLAGVGNIYADEALHRARIHPLRRSDSLSPAEVSALLRGIRQALRSGLRHNGASIDWVYRGGEFQNHFRVYQRTGEPCPVCSKPVTRIVVAQRGTHFCPSCQPAREG